MTEENPIIELNRINGALEVLGLIREMLLMQQDELGAETAQESVEEIQTRIDALLLEYERRRKALHPQHKSYQFILTEAEVFPLAHDCYVELVRGEAISKEFSGQTLRLADWYVRMDNDSPKKVVNENYSWLVIDEFGRADLHAAKAIETTPLPSHDKRDEIKRCLFETT